MSRSITAQDPRSSSAGQNAPCPREALPRIPARLARALMATCALFLGAIAAPAAAHAQSCPPQAPWFCEGCDGYCCPASHRYCTTRCTCSATALSCPEAAPYFCDGHGGYCCPASHRFCTVDGTCTDDSSAVEGLVDTLPNDEWTCTTEGVEASGCRTLAFCVDRLTATRAFYEADGQEFPCEAADRIDACLAQALAHCGVPGSGGNSERAASSTSGCSTSGGRPFMPPVLALLAMAALRRRTGTLPTTPSRT